MLLLRGICHSSVAAKLVVDIPEEDCWAIVRHHHDRRANVDSKVVVVMTFYCGGGGDAAGSFGVRVLLMEGDRNACHMTKFVLRSTCENI